MTTKFNGVFHTSSKRAAEALYSPKARRKSARSSNIISQRQSPARWREEKPA